MPLTILKLGPMLSIGIPLPGLSHEFLLVPFASPSVIPAQAGIQTPVVCSLSFVLTVYWKFDQTGLMRLPCIPCAF